MGEPGYDIFIPHHPSEPLGEDIKEKEGEDEAADSGMTSVPDDYAPQALSEVSVVAEDDPYMGAIVGGKYRVERKLGQGGMGIVYLGVNDELGQRVAIKFLSKRFIDDEGIVQRFLNEARSYCRVNHPNAVTLLEYGQHEDGTLYIITEFVDGKNLSDTMQETGPLPTEQIMPIAFQLCEVLAAAHQQGVIHRDLKPDNLMLTPTSRGRYILKVLDFGIAKIIDDDEYDGPTTETGSVFGTPEFMAPEQARGMTAEPRSDIYAVGLILFYMLTGKLPFRGKNKLIVLNKQLNEPPPRPSEFADVPPKLEALVLKCLNKHPEQRYESADDLHDALEELTVPGGASTSRLGAVKSEPEESFQGSPQTPQPIRANTVRLGEWDDHDDGHADTLASNLDEDVRLAELESIEMWREQPTSETRVKRPTGVKHARVIAGVVAFSIVAIALVIGLRSGERGDDGIDVQNLLVTGQVLGLLTAVEDMIRDGNIEAAEKSLSQTELWMTDEELKPAARERRDALQSSLTEIRGAQGELVSAAKSKNCNEAKAAHQRLADESAAFAATLQTVVDEACAVKSGPKPAPTPPEVVPADSVEPTSVDPEPVDEPVAGDTKTAVEPDPEPEDKADTEPTEDSEIKNGEEKTSEEVPDGMALPPKQID